jgi:hypothetical protein
MPEGLELAFNLILFLGEHSFYPDESQGHGNQPSGEPAEEVLLKLAKRMKKDPSFEPMQ